MSEERLKAFLEKVKADTSLQEKLKAASDANAASAIAKEAGFSISADEFLDEFTKAQSKLSDEELERGAGGRDWDTTSCPHSCLGCPPVVTAPWVCPPVIGD